MQMQNQAVSVLLGVCQLVIHFAAMSKLKKTKLLLQTSPPLVRYMNFGKFIFNWHSASLVYNTTVQCQVAIMCTYSSSLTCNFYHLEQDTQKICIHVIKLVIKRKLCVNLVFPDFRISHSHCVLNSCTQEMSKTCQLNLDTCVHLCTCNNLEVKI